MCCNHKCISNTTGNQSLESGEEPFRILALGNAPDWSVLKKPDDRNDVELRRAVWHGETEADWAAVILEQVVALEEKALVYCGIHHAFTRYRQPIYDVRKKQFIRFGDVRAGNHVYNAIGDQTMTIYVHASWVSARGYDHRYVHPVNGAIDLIMKASPPGTFPVGFDTAGTPFADLPSTTCQGHLHSHSPASTHRYSLTLL